MIIFKYANGSRSIDAGDIAINFDDVEPIPNHDGMLRLTKNGVFVGIVTKVAFDAATVETVEKV